MASDDRALATRAKNGEGSPAIFVDGVYYSTLAEIVQGLIEEKWYYLVMEGEAETHEGCLGPECDCWKLS